MRLDLLLIRLRFARSRSVAHDWVATGHFRCNRTRVMKPSHPIALGDVLTLPMRNHVQLIEILALPERRGPASEAQSHYRTLDDGNRKALAGHTTSRLLAETGHTKEGLLPP